VVDGDQLKAARRVLALQAIYQDIEDLVNIGAYVAGVNGEFDLAVQARPKILQYLQQDSRSPSTMEQSRKQLVELAGWIEQMDRALKAQAAKPAGKK
jgi:flagellum-specific ATP synthase